MRKGQQQVIDKAIALKISKQKTNYLMQEGKSIWFYNKIFPIFLIYEDVELGDLLIFDNILNFIKTYKIKNIDKEFSHFLWAVESSYRCYEHKISISDISEFIKNNEYADMPILDLMRKGISYRDAKNAYSDWIKLGKPDYYMDILGIVDGKHNMLFDYSIKKQYADYFCRIENYMDKYNLHIISIVLKQCFENNISVSDAIEMDFSLDKLKSYLLRKKFPFIKRRYLGENQHYLKVYPDEESKTALEKMAILLPEGKSITINASTIKLEMTLCINSVNIIFTRYSQMYINSDCKEANYTKQASYTKLVWFFSNKFYRATRNEKLIPLSLKDICYFSTIYGNHFVFLWKGLTKELIKSSPVFKDLEPYIYKKYIGSKAFPPITVNECVGKYHLKQLFTEKYKDGCLINWNKTNIVLGYTILKALPQVNKNYRGKLIALKDHDSFHEAKYISKLCKSPCPKETLLQDAIMIFLEPSSYWKNQSGNSVSKATVRTMVADYINLCKLLKLKVDLSYKSAKKLKARHDTLSIKYRNRHVPTIIIPKESKFNNLRNILPEEFVWIKNKKQLILEGVVMHHCVASYANYINRDECAIYSFIDPNTEIRYTIELRIMKGNYYIRQIQSKYNGGCPKNVREYVKGLLKYFN